MSSYVTIIQRFLRKSPLLRPSGFLYGLGSKNGGRLFCDMGVLHRRKPSGSFILFAGRIRQFSGWHNSTVEQYSDDEYECEFEKHIACSSVTNIDEWKWRLSLLFRNNEEKEIVSKDKNDRRDYEQIAALARRMGLFRFQVSNMEK